MSIRAQPAPAANSSWLFPALLVAAVVLAYANCLRAPFIFDDTGAIQKNSTIRHLWSLAVFNPPVDGSTTTGRPLVNLTFALNYALSGERVWSYHALNLALHALAALTLFGLLRRTFSILNLAAPGAVAFATALLWAVHPLLTETVVCVAQRTELLCGLLYLLTLYAFARDPDSPRWRALSIVACVLGMAAKEVMVTAPLAVLLYDRTFVAGNFSAALRARPRYYAALAATWLLLALLVLHGGGTRGAAAGFGLGVSWWDYLLTQNDALVRYLRLSVWPHPLVLDYGNAVVHSLAEVWWQALVVVALLAVTLRALVRRPVLGFAGAVCFLILAPSSSIVPLVEQTIAEHRMYLPLGAVLALAVAAAAARFGARALWFAGAFAVVLGIATVVRNYDYRDPIVIWSDTVEKIPTNARAHNDLAVVQLRAGQLESANAHFTRALELRPDYISAHHNFGAALLDQGRLPEAIAHLEAALRLSAGDVDSQVNLGHALVRAGRAAEAIPHYETALRLQPAAADVNYDLGIASLELDHFDEAAAFFRAALQLDPALPEAHFRLARLADRAGQTAEAESQYRATLQFAPGHADAHGRLGLLYARANQLAPAAEHLRAAVQLNPTDVNSRVNLGNVLLQQGDPSAALAQYEEALRLRPNDPRTLENIGVARAALH